MMKQKQKTVLFLLRQEEHGKNHEFKSNRVLLRKVFCRFFEIPCEIRKKIKGVYMLRSETKCLEQLRKKSGHGKDSGTEHKAVRIVYEVYKE